MKEDRQWHKEVSVPVESDNRCHGRKSNTVGGLCGVTVGDKQLKLCVFLFGVRVGFGEKREVTRGDGVSEGWV